MNGSNFQNFQIEQQCPQCGAPIILDETDRILSCKFCRTRVYLAIDDHFRFYIPQAPGISEPVFFVPYWRLRGLSYAVGAGNISYRYFDANFLSFDSTLLPHSIGLRPQAMKLKFVGNRDDEGKFVSSAHRTKDDLLKHFKAQAGAGEEIFIGETASVIYTPVYCAEGRVYDAVLKKPLDLQRRDAEVEEALLKASEEKWHVEFLPLICPECGADLPGEKNALVVFCQNCHRAWDPSNKNFTEVKFSAWQEKGEDISYLPFWQMKIKVNGLKLETYADLIRVANLPKAPAPKWEQTPFYFCAPAFKINAALFLRWCKQLTSAPSPQDLTMDFLAKKIHPVTLPLNEALESSMVTLSSLIGNKKINPVNAEPPSNFIIKDFVMDDLPFKISTRETTREGGGFSMKSSTMILNSINSGQKNLPDLTSLSNYTLEDFSLVLHPFRISARELIHTKLGFSLDLSSLNMGDYL